MPRPLKKELRVNLKVLPDSNRFNSFIMPCFAARTKASEEKFVKLREVYQKLRSEHIVLLRTNGESQKQLQSVEKEKSTAEEEVKVRIWSQSCLV